VAPPSRPRKLQAVADAIFGSDGHTDRALRRDVGAFVTAIVNGRDVGEAAPAVPEKLRPYLQKLAKHAYQVTDDDLAALRSDGYSEDMIFEITTSAALAAALAQMDRGLAALAAASSDDDPPKGAR